MTAVSQPMPRPAAVRSLAHPGTDPASLVRRAQTALGWHGSDFLVGLSGYPELLATLEVATDLDALVRVGDPSSPRITLLRGLAAIDAAAGLRLTRVASVRQPWRWTRLGTDAATSTASITGIALRQQTYSDVVDALGPEGLDFRVLPDRTTTAELLEVGRPLGSAVLDADEVPGLPEGAAAELDGGLDRLPPVTYGLLSRDAARPDDVDVVWLSLAAERESAGTLMAALERFSRLGVDLDFLHSDPQGEGHHYFYLGFAGDLATVDAVAASLAEVHFTIRVLACFGRPAP